MILVISWDICEFVPCVLIMLTIFLCTCKSARNSGLDWLICLRESRLKNRLQLY